jgi:hypothetical protein
VSEPQALLDAQTVAFLSGIIIPLLVGLLSKVSASSGLKAILNAFLSALAGVLATVTQVDSANARDFVIAIISTWVVSVATYYGVWKPTGVAGTVVAKSAGFGLGPDPKAQTEDKGVEDLGDRLSGASKAQTEAAIEEIKSENSIPPPPG